MGCSASKPGTILTKTSENRSNSSSSSSSSPTTTSHSTSESSNPYPPNPVRRAFSLSTPLVHHPPLRKGDTHHLVSLTSTTYGSLLIDRKSAIDTSLNSRNQIPQKPKSSIQTHPELSLSPDSVINTWELMDGLDDFDLTPSIYDRPISFPTQPSSCRYTCFDGSTKKRLNLFELVKRSESFIEDSSSSSSTTKPLWQHLSEESLLSKMDPNVGLTYRRALSSRQLGYKHSKTRSLGASPLNSSTSNNFLRLPGTEDKIVIYFTSLRGIRKTYEDCSSVRMIFQGFRVAVDERDISMDSEFKKELQSALRGKMMSLPQVFIRGKYIGGAEQVRKLHENGELGLLLEGFPVMESGFCCHGCGDARFLPCPNCNGSRKVFEEEEGEIRRCSDCNENGLIRCPACCS